MEIVPEDLIREVYGIESEIVYHKGVPLVVPRYSSKYEHADDHHHHEGHEHDIHDHLVVGEEDLWEKESDPFE
jgi:iron complex transport system ATP-binding protein